MDALIRQNQIRPEHGHFKSCNFIKTIAVLTAIATPIILGIAISIITTTLAYIGAFRFLKLPMMNPKLALALKIILPAMIGFSVILVGISISFGITLVVMSICVYVSWRSVQKRNNLTLNRFVETTWESRRESRRVKRVNYILSNSRFTRLPEETQKLILHLDGCKEYGSNTMNLIVRAGSKIRHDYTTPSADLMPGRPVIKRIRKNMTPKEFEELRKQNPDYKIEDPGKCANHALLIAVHEGNIKLVKHILSEDEKSVEKIINLGNEFNQTPLFMSVYYTIFNDGDENAKDTGFLMGKMLLEKGANPNIAISYTFGNGFFQMPVDATSLWLASESENIPFTKLLLENGAVKYQDLETCSVGHSPKGNAIICKANEIINEKDLQERINFLNLEQFDFQIRINSGLPQTISLFVCRIFLI